MSKHEVKSTVREYVDQDTGEISLIETQKTHIIKVVEEEFFMMHVKLLKNYYDLDHVSDFRLIVKLCELAEFNTGSVSISTGKRQEICKELNINTTNFSKYIKRLKDKKLITGDKGEYLINPGIFWKGDRRERKKLLDSGSLSVVFEFRKEE